MRSKNVRRYTSLMLVFVMVLSFFAVPVKQAAAAEGDVISVAEAIANNSGTATVEGYIVAHTTAPNSYDFEAPFGNDYNLAIADSASEKDPAKLLPVQLQGQYQTEFGLKTNPDLIGTKIQVTGSLEEYFSSPGLKSPTNITKVDGGTDPEPEPVELSTIADARNAADGTAVKVKGIATAAFTAGGATNLYIQDNTAGIIVRAAGITANVGDEVTVEGTIGDYYGMEQITTTSDKVAVTSANAGVPAPQEITSSQLGEDVEGMLVKVNNVTVNSVNSHGEYVSTDGSAEFLVDPETEGLLEAGKTYDSIIGVINYSFGEYRLVPRNAADVIETAFSVMATPAAGEVVQGTEVTLFTGIENGTIYYTTDGSEPTASSQEYTGPIAINEDVTIKAIVVNATGEASEAAVFTYTATEPLGQLEIHDIQGAAHESPFKGQTVTDIEGIVTQVDGSSFHMQSLNPDDDIATSEGIMVYKRGADVQVGDIVKATGEVKEYKIGGYDDAADLLTTEIAATTVTVISSGNTLPDPVVIGVDRIQPTKNIEDDGLTSFDPKTDGIDFYESLEGMLIQLNDPKVIAPPKYDEIAVFVETSEDQLRTDAGGLLISPEDYNPERVLIDVDGFDVDVKVGDSFDGSITGVISYDYSNYKVRVTDSALPAVIDGGTTQEVTNIEKEEDKLTVASYNIENYSLADSGQLKTDQLAESINKNLKTPDIIGLIEVQDNNGPTDDGTTSASANYEALIAAIEAGGGPTYAFTEIAPLDKTDGGQPGGNIRVGYLYNPERVSLTDKEKGDATTAVGVNENGLTLNPGRIDPTNTAWDSSRKPLAAEFEFNGEKVIVIANHFNSKGGDDGLFGANQPVVLGSEEQRIQQAKVINSFVNDVVSTVEDANVVVLGDLNDFEFSTPINTLEGDVLTNLMEKLPSEERYTYVYQGNSQVLDHILVSNNLAATAEIDSVNINADFSHETGRASDHDPVLAQLDLGATEEDGNFDLTVMHTNDTHAHLNNVARRITAIKEVREAAENSILLDAGDVFSGTLFFNQYKGLADVEFMNMIGYDAMVPGNHEFDKDSETLANFINAAEFPIVSSNIDYSGDGILGQLYKNEVGDPAADGHIYPAIILDVNGEKVGVFGLTTEDTTFLANPDDSLVFEDRIQKANDTVSMLQDEGVNKIIALTHIGYNQDLALAKAVDGIDIIVGGHSHTKVDEPVVFNEDAEPTIVVQAQEYSNYLGDLDVEFDQNGVLLSWNENLIDLNDETITPDPAAQERLDELEAPIQELKQQIVGKTDVFLNGERQDVRTKETNLGNLIADGMLAKAQESVDATLAIQNGGGIRASIDEGDISLGEVLTTMPFGNTLVTLDLTGAEVIEALENGVSQVEEMAGRFPQVAGMKFSYNPEQSAGERVIDVQVKTDNGYEPIDLNKMYTVATNAYVADGGDGYTVFKKAKDEGRITELYVVDYEVFTDYLQEKGTVSPEVEGRILEVTDMEAPVTTAKVTGVQLSDGSYLAEATVELTAADADSGVERIEYSLDNGQTWNTYTEPFTVQADATILYRAVDKAGNAEEAKTLTISIVPASTETLKELVNSADASHGVKTSINAHIKNAEKMFEKGTEKHEELGYKKLATLAEKISRYPDNKLSNKEDLKLVIDYIVENETMN
ncbi:5'-nucleotidase C-terminal domain-containing protein [Pseudalkalibacillus caeni]|uniref:5'-nucleotidase n=1 Tax=Exobacillus caeni TaxID=2574798 RepID=A0A5R9F528_9BACL|nr:5'-nucleotidase C-terminal domain-containing protein [Pseudalkalibacillus caeni]TLS35584.1 hypothetical protein FCL54_19695 [Pseudalkalibacillus caeni]